MTDVEYFILGPLAVRMDRAEPPLALDGKPRLLLGRLLVDAGTVVAIATLEHDVWGRAVSSNTVQAAVSRLRGRLDHPDGPTAVDVVGAGYRLNADPLMIDAKRFMLLVEHAQQLRDRHPEAARAMLEEALASWRGRVLGDDADAEWVAAPARELETARDRAEVLLNGVLLDLGEHERTEVLVRGQIVRHPEDDRRRVQLIQALEGMRRTSEAGQAYREAVADLGTVSGELRRTGDRIGSWRREAAAARPAAGAVGPWGDAILLDARLDPRDRAAGEAGQGTLALLVARRGGDPYVFGDDRVLGVFEAPDAALSVGREAAYDWRLRCSVGVHVGAAVPFAGTLAGAGSARSRLLSAAAHPGRVLLSSDARRRHWPSLELIDHGEQRYEDLLPGEPVYELPHEGADAEHPPPRTLSRRPHNLPAQRTRFVGRSRELATISGGVVHGRLVTLRGTGGCGKTRLALQLAARRIASFEHGAWFLELGELETDAGAPAVALAMLSQLGVRTVGGEGPVDTLVEYLSDRDALLVVDNCEHVLVGVGEVLAAVLEACPRVGVIATSVERLGLTGEHVFTVQPMRTDADPGGETLSDAAELLLDRAGWLPEALAGGTDAMELIREICEDLEGLPFGIELAASQIPARGLEHVAIEVKEVLSGHRELRSLSSADPDRPLRQETMESIIQWSHDLLAEHERLVLHRLAVFRGSFGPDEADRVVRLDGALTAEQVRAALDHLVEQGLVAVEPPVAWAPRLRLLQTTRAFALSQLKRSGEYDSARARHADVYLALARDTAATLLGPGEVAGLERLGAEHDNLRAALAFLVDTRRSEPALVLAGALWWFWFARGHFEEGAEALREVLALSATPSRARVLALRAASHLTWWNGRYEETTAYNRELAACAGAIDDEWGLAWAPMGEGAVLLQAARLDEALIRLEDSRRRYEALECAWEAGYALQLIAAVRWYSGDEAAAAAAYEETLEIYRKIGHGSVLASVQRGLGLMLARCGDVDSGRVLCRRALEYSASIGDPVGRAQALNFLGAISREEDDLSSAAEQYATALSLSHGIRDLWGTCLALDGVSHVASAYGEHELAARLSAHSMTRATRAGYARPATEQRMHDELEATLEAQLPSGVLQRAVTEGQAMSGAEALASVEAFVSRLS